MAKSDHHPRSLDLRVAVPATWIELDLDPATRTESFARLVEARGLAAQAAGVAPGDLVAMLEGVAARARAAGAVYAAVYSDVIDGIQVSASLIASVVDGQGPPPPPGTDAAAVARGLVPMLAGSGPAEVRTLPAGPAVRVRTSLDAPVPGGGTAPVDNVRYAVPLPGLDRLALLEFSTPSLDLSDAFAGLFDAIAATLTWS